MSSAAGKETSTVIIPKGEGAPSTTTNIAVKAESSPEPAAAITGTQSAPRTIGNFRVLCHLGSGGMARVYLCQTRGLGGFEKLVVLKVPRAGLMEETEVRQMFLHEARIAGRLNHPNIVQTNEVGLANGLPFIAMEYLEGHALASLQRQVRLSELSTHFQLRIIAQALAGAHHAHELLKPDGTSYELVHRDISPQNVFITYDGAVKILDFGIAKVSSAEREQTQAGTLKGKLAYIAPEQAAGLRVDRRADVFAFGVMIWEAIAHRHLVARGRQDFDVLRDRITGDEPRIDTVVPDADSELVAICTRAMARIPEERFQTALELKLALDRYLARIPGALDEDIGAYIRTVFAERRLALRSSVDAALRRSEEEHTAIMMLPPEETAPGAAVTPSRGTTTGSMIHPPPSMAKRLGPFALIAGAVIVAALIFSRKPTVPAEGAATTPKPEVTATASVAPVAPQVHVELRAHPATAQIFVDGVAAPMPGSVFTRDVGPSPDVRKVKISAPGYQPLQRDVVFDRDLAMDFTLDEVRVQKPNNGGGFVRRPPTGGPTKGPGDSKIDEKDPYR